jgi:hypothetical protein
MTKILAGGVAMAALAAAAPAAAQYYPGYGYGGGYGGGYGYGSPYGYGNGGVIGSIINGVTGGYGGGYGYNGYGYGGGANSQVAVNQCASAVQQRLSGGGYGGYGYNGYASGGGRVLGISRIEPRSNGGLTVRGVASSGRYGYSYGGQQQIDLTWKCRTDIRGFITGIEVDVAQPAYGSNYNNNYTPWGNYDYSQYGYRRY